MNIVLRATYDRFKTLRDLLVRFGLSADVGITPLVIPNKHVWCKRAAKITNWSGSGMSSIDAAAWNGLSW